MLSTELISIPTGFTFLCGMMTLWRGQIRFTVPMLFCLAWFFNFLIGGLSGVFLSDVPSDVTTHGSFFSMAHFHYTIMGGLVFTFFAGDLLLGAEDDGLPAERAAREDPLLDDVHLRSTRPSCRCSPPASSAMPRRVVTYPTQPAVPQRLGVDRRRSCSASRCCSSSTTSSSRCVFDARAGPAEPVVVASIEWQLPSPVPVHNFDRIPVFTSDPYGYGEPPAPLPVPGGRPGGEELMSELAHREHRLRGRRGRAAGGPRPEPHLGRPPARERDRVLLPRVRLRLLLPPLAEQRAAVEAEARRRRR